MKQIRLTKGKFAIVDDEDFDRVNCFTWHTHKAGYGARNTDKKTMHRFIINAKPGQIVDHINGNPADNRKENLRLCTQMENCRNQSLKSCNKTGYKGVSWDKKYRKYSSFLTVNYKHIFGGYFDNKEDAARAYNKLALEHHGSFAKLNQL